MTCRNALFHYSSQIFLYKLNRSSLTDSAHGRSLQSSLSFSLSSSYGLKRLSRDPIKHSCRSCCTPVSFTPTECYEASIFYSSFLQALAAYIFEIYSVVPAFAPLSVIVLGIFTAVFLLLRRRKLHVQATRSMCRLSIHRASSRIHFCRASRRMSEMGRA